MTARDVIVEMREEIARTAADPDHTSAAVAQTLQHYADRLESTLAQPSGEAVAWADAVSKARDLPWRAEGAKVLHASSCGTVECCGIAECCHGSNPDEAEANARAIVAAVNYCAGLITGGSGEPKGGKFGKPLDKPARVGATVFRVGVGSDLVVQRAQREYEYHLNPPPYDKAVLQAALAAAQCTCAQTPGAGCSNCPPDAAPCPRAEDSDAPR